MKIKKYALIICGVLLCGITYAQQHIIVSWDTTSLTYNGNPQMPSVVDDTLSLEYSGQQTNVGENYKAWVTCINPAYVLENDTVYFSITALSTTVAWSDTIKVYNGQAQVPTATAIGIGGSEIPLMLSDSTNTDADTYKLWARTMDNNYSLTNDTLQSFVITPDSVLVAWSDTIKVYNGQAQVPTATAISSGGSKILLALSDSTKTDANTYKLWASTTDNNYHLSNDTLQSFEITPDSVLVAWSDTTFVWDGYPHSPTAKFVDVKGDSIPLTVTDEQTAVGDHTATASTDDDNYTLTNEMFKWSILCPTFPTPIFSGEITVCSNSYDIIYSVKQEDNIAYHWAIDGGEIVSGENSNSIVVYWNSDAGIGTLTLTQIFTPQENACKTYTTYYITKTTDIAPNTTNIIRKGSSNILICEDATQGIYYQWGWRKSDTKEEMPFKDPQYPDFSTYQYFEFETIDTDNYEYFVDIKYSENGCTTRSFYKPDIQQRAANIQQITVYPNPAKNHFSVALGAEVKGKVLVSLQNLSGQTLLSKQIADYKNNEVLQFDFNFPASGFYLLVVHTNENVLTSKIVVE